MHVLWALAAKELGTDQLKREAAATAAAVPARDQLLANDLRVQFLTYFPSSSSFYFFASSKGRHSKLKIYITDDVFFSTDRRGLDSRDSKIAVGMGFTRMTQFLESLNKKIYI